MRGAFVGMDLTSTRADLTRAVYEGVALNAAWLLEPFSAFTGVAYDEITFGGGAARSRFWGELLAAGLGIRVHRLADAHLTNARGAALLAFGVLGHVAPDLEGVSLPIAETHHAPPEAIAHAADRRERLASFHTSLRDWYHRANR